MNFKNGFEKTAIVSTVGRLVAAPLKAAYKVGKWGVQKVTGKGLMGLGNLALIGGDAVSSGSDYYKKMITAR